MINEVVVATRKNNRDNKAPIGVYFKDKKVIMHLFFGSHTYENLLTEDYFSVNIVPPIEIAKAVLDDNDEYLYYDNIPYLKNSYYTIFYKVVKREFVERDDKFGKNRLMIVEGEEIKRIYLDKVPKPYNRADGLLVEMAVIYSRLANKNIKIDEDDKKEMEKEMKKYFSIIKKVGGREHKQLAEIMLRNLNLL
ncbi:hypothetical protein JH146_0574 [Methanocaldococcus bathoardescens]|uniref:DUF447 family protein n=1 Tax=Methanocaldococcus bathoardescens TaxID=1301915 RepID=A0A076LG17_9EURY|nr:DUF447 domain-containing protein [Methanocaldococcus bathoardescens]AIJ05423.1 hypothetical protein JH146_0574 [Methanocaldococcus bathoardescens]